MLNLTTVADWAATLGISRQQGYAAIKRCGITVADGKLDPEYATVLYHRHTRVKAGAAPKDEGAGGPAKSASSAGASDYANQRARRESAEATIAEMKAAEMSGKFLVKADVESSLFEMARAIRDGMTNCARRIAADVVGLPTAEECEAVIEREHRALLEDLVLAAQDQLGARIGEGIDQ